MSIIIGELIVSTYSTPTDVSNILNTAFTSTTVPTDSQVTDIIIRTDSYIDTISGHNWRVNTVTNEEYDAIGTGPRAGTIILRNGPVISIEDFAYWDGGAKTWVSGFSGFPEEAPDKQTYYAYLENGKLVWHKLRLDQRQRYRASYTYGYNSPPDFIRDLSASIAAREVVLFYAGAFNIQEDISKFKERLDQKITRLINISQRPRVQFG